jgi:hypothetical protein
MVMRNQSNGSDAPRWWDDLPPQVRKRVSQPPAADRDAPAPTPAPPGRAELVRDLSRLAVLFLLVALGIMLYLLVAVTFVTG